MDRKITNPLYSEELYADASAAEHTDAYLDVTELANVVDVATNEDANQGLIANPAYSRPEDATTASYSHLQSPAKPSVVTDFEVPVTRADVDRIDKAMRQLKWTANFNIVISIVVVILLLMGHPQRDCSSTSIAGSASSQANKDNEQSGGGSGINNQRTFANYGINVSLDTVAIDRCFEDHFGSAGSNFSYYWGIDSGENHYVQGGHSIYSYFNRAIESINASVSDLTFAFSTSNINHASTGNGGRDSSDAVSDTCSSLLSGPTFCSASGPTIRMQLQDAFDASRSSGSLINRLTTNVTNGRPALDKTHPSTVVHSFAVGDGSRIVFVMDGGKYQIMDNFVRSGEFHLQFRDRTCSGSGDVRVVTRPDGTRVFTNNCFHSEHGVYQVNASAPPETAITYVGWFGVRDSFDISPTRILFYHDTHGYGPEMTIQTYDIVNSTLVYDESKRKFLRSGGRAEEPRIYLDTFMAWFSHAETVSYVRLDDMSTVMTLSWKAGQRALHVFEIGEDLALMRSYDSNAGNPDSIIEIFDVSTGYAIAKGQANISAVHNSDTHTLPSFSRRWNGIHVGNCSYILPMKSSSGDFRIMTFSATATGIEATTSWLRPPHQGGMATLDVWLGNLYINFARFLFVV
eukprot:TRINITY_DN7935_c0_g2_i1.p1 TRINITY_DN7935_c0_g2~~TRINITY_DN7935_c0_g2_i1.p1  ORF type:complete len:631 (+),score=69.19 TRINITY_DN7935_c0_g2_i1:21-1913(+)